MEVPRHHPLGSMLSYDDDLPHSAALIKMRCADTSCGCTSAYSWREYQAQPVSSARAHANCKSRRTSVQASSRAVRTAVTTAACLAAIASPTGCLARIVNNCGTDIGYPAGGHREPRHHATRDCFVLCVTSSTGDHRKSGGRRRGEHSKAVAEVSDSVHRTQAGIASSSFLHRATNGILRNGRGRSLVAGALKCRAGGGEEPLDGLRASRGGFRRILDRIRGFKPLAASRTTGIDMIKVSWGWGSA